MTNYKFSDRLKNFSRILMLLGILGLTYGFFTSPTTVGQANEIVADSHHEEGHSQQISEEVHEGDAIGHEQRESLSDQNDHGEHLLHKLQNKPWAALYVAALFFMMISLGTLAFYAIQRASQAGWSPVLYRVMEGITAYLLPGCLIVLLILILSGIHMNHLFIWMDPEVVVHDELIRSKTGFLNVPFFLVRACFYILGWCSYRYFSRRFSLAQDVAKDISYHKKNFRISAAFLVFFIVTESMMSWDWIMSIDPHWFSTLFGWYVFASMFVSGITVIALVTIYLKSKGYLELVNDSHIHDLGKFMFGISIFWAYLWFSQFMLIWYSNIPEEVTYFITRIEDYNLPFFSMLALNFILPILILMNSDYKRINYFIVMTGIIIIMGHYVDVFNMIMPSAVGDQWFFGVSEISAFIFFSGLFIYIVFREISKASLYPNGDPFIEESKRYHY